jgi:hypothetical protein
MKKIFKRFALVSVILLALFTLVSIPLLAAQTTTDLTSIFENPVVQLILAGIMGIPLAGIIEIFKRGLIQFLKINPDWAPLGYVSSALAVLAVAAAIMIPLHAFTIGAWLINSFAAWAVANGLYKKDVKAPQGK